MRRGLWLHGPMQRESHLTGARRLALTPPSPALCACPFLHAVVKHDVPGIIGMANLDQPHTASTQFYITTSPLPWLDGKRVAFGRLLTKSSERCMQHRQYLL